jgi:class 3 adenylate cyclase
VFQPPAHLTEKIRTQLSTIEGERRQVTVLFGDIAGFTAISEKLDPEISVKSYGTRARVDLKDNLRGGSQVITLQAL